MGRKLYMSITPAAEAGHERTASGRDTRQTVLENARRLFNEKGVGDVSMRAVAAACGISVGNLTYYFPRKADLVRALMTEDVSETLVHEKTVGLEQLDHIFSNMIRALLRHPFFFLDDQAQSMLQKTAMENVQQIHSQFDPVLDELIGLGLMRREFQGGVRRGVMSVLLLSHITWLKAYVRNSGILQLTPQELLDAHWTVLSPWLTEEGLKAKERLPCDRLRMNENT